MLTLLLLPEALHTCCLLPFLVPHLKCSCILTSKKKGEGGSLDLFIGPTRPFLFSSDHHHHHPK